MVRDAKVLPKVKPHKIAAPKPADRRPERPDLQTQFEEMLDQVWRCESEWRFDDRIDMALHIKRP